MKKRTFDEVAHDIYNSMIRHIGEQGRRIEILEKRCTEIEKRMHKMEQDYFKKVLKDGQDE